MSREMPLATDLDEMLHVLLTAATAHGLGLNRGNMLFLLDEDNSALWPVGFGHLREGESGKIGRGRTGHGFREITVTMPARHASLPCTRSFPTISVGGNDVFTETVRTGKSRTVNVRDAVVAVFRKFIQPERRWRCVPPRRQRVAGRAGSGQQNSIGTDQRRDHQPIADFLTRSALAIDNAHTSRRTETPS